MDPPQHDLLSKTEVYLLTMAIEEDGCRASFGVPCLGTEKIAYLARF
jgi:hypothetical protein